MDSLLNKFQACVIMPFQRFSNLTFMALIIRMAQWHRVLLCITRLGAKGFQTSNFGNNNQSSGDITQLCDGRHVIKNIFNTNSSLYSSLLREHTS